jgi:hypothetical protein
MAWTFGPSILLGHKSVRTTEQHYAHFVAAHQALLEMPVIDAQVQTAGHQ